MRIPATRSILQRFSPLYILSDLFADKFQNLLWACQEREKGPILDGAGSVMPIKIHSSEAEIPSSSL